MLGQSEGNASAILLKVRSISLCYEKNSNKKTGHSSPENKKSDRRGSNPRSRPWQGRALPTTPLSQMSCEEVRSSSTRHIIPDIIVVVKCFFEKI
jgi:hypothetical protein